MKLLQDGPHDAEVYEYGNRFNTGAIGSARRSLAGVSAFARAGWYPLNGPKALC